MAVKDYSKVPLDELMSDMVDSLAMAELDRHPARYDWGWRCGAEKVLEIRAKIAKNLKEKAEQQ